MAKCNVRDCLGLQKFQVVAFCYVASVEGIQPMAFDLPVKVCTLHRNQEIANILKNQDTSRAIWQGMKEQGFPHPEEFPIRIGFKLISEPAPELH